MEDWALAPDSPDERKDGLKRVLTCLTQPAVIILERSGHFWIGLFSFSESLNKTG